MATSPLIGTSLPVLVDIMGRVTWAPFLGALWSDQWPWVSLIILVYHFMVYLPLRLLVPALPAAQTWPSLETEPVPRQMVMIIMPIVAIGAALVGAIVRRMLRVPFHFVPISHLLRSIWPINSPPETESSMQLLTPEAQRQTQRPHASAAHSSSSHAPLPPISQRFSVYATIAFLVSTAGSLAAQEIYAWVHGGGTALDWLMVFMPLVLTTVTLIPSLFFDPHETHALYGSGSHVRTRALIAAAKIVVPTALVTVIPLIVGIYIRNVNVAILSASLVIVGVLLVSVILNVTLFVETPELYKGIPQRSHTGHRGGA